ncbi:putative C6 finger domain protein [Lentithecium fluviatile CBS 122367]|uniref:Putative C6 finger domain protein n=1 Tax=Lentithecium fluviatile CBS 122367 TaxID=1168545 RepID=A0A6G1J431_9PLEO|nr:putative C6 finger domain protein [Lentithecium fluviatile CBS 122367]
MSYRRRRTPLACTLCRKRKRRCDAQKPTCGTCKELEAECVYEEMPTETISLHPEADMQESLNRVENLVHNNSVQLAALIETIQRRHSPTSPTFQPSFVGNIPLAAESSNSAGISFSGVMQEHELVPPLSIPDKHSTSSNHLLLNPTIREMIGQYPSDYFLRLESKNEIPMQSPLQELAMTGYVGFDKPTTDALVAAFFSKVHCYHPILNRDEFEALYNSVISRGFAPGPNTCLCLVILALGATAIRENVPSPLPGIAYMQKVLPELLLASTWSFSWNVRTSQALILASVYFSYLARPLYSWRLINLAATHTHFLLPRLEALPTLGSISSREGIIRCFWSCFMIESDRLAELEIPQSSLQKLVDHMPLPSFRSGSDDSETTYYLAEISLRRLFNRIHNSVYPRLMDLGGEGTGTFERDQLGKLFSICDELHLQLRTWHKSIPEPFRPDVTGARPAFHDRERVLGIRYFAALHIIHRPFVLHAVALGKNRYAGTTDENMIVSEPIIDKCRVCLESCRIYIRRATETLQQLSPYTWTFSISSLGAILVLTMAVQCEQLKALVPDLDDLQSLVIDHVEPCAMNLKTEHGTQSESSLEAAVGILKEIRRKCRMRNLFD